MLANIINIWHKIDNIYTGTTMGMQQQRAKVSRDNLESLLGLESAKNPAEAQVSSSGNIEKMPSELAKALLTKLNELKTESKKEQERLHKETAGLQEADAVTEDTKTSNIAETKNTETKEREVVFRQVIETGEILFEFQLIEDHPDHKLLGRFPESKIYRFVEGEGLKEIIVNPKYFPMGLPEVIAPVCRLKRDEQGHSVGVVRHINGAAETHLAQDVVEGEVTQQDQTIQGDEAEGQGTPNQATAAKIQPSIPIVLKAKKEKDLSDFRNITDPKERSKFNQANQIDNYEENVKANHRDNLIYERALHTQKLGLRNDNDVWFQKEFVKGIDDIKELFPAQIAEMMGNAPKARYFGKSSAQNRHVLLSKSVRTQEDIGYIAGLRIPFENVSAKDYWQQDISIEGCLRAIATEIKVGKSDTSSGYNRTALEDKDGKKRVATFDFGINQNIFYRSFPKIKDDFRGLGTALSDTHHAEELAIIISNFHEMTDEQKDEFFAALYASREMNADCLDHLPCVVSGQFGGEELEKVKKFFEENKKTFLDWIIEKPEEVSNDLDANLGEEICAKLSPSYDKARSMAEKKINELAKDFAEFVSSLEFSEEHKKSLSFLFNRFIKDMQSKEGFLPILLPKILAGKELGLESPEIIDVFGNKQSSVKRYLSYIEAKDSELSKEVEEYLKENYIKKLNEDPEIKKAVADLREETARTEEKLRENMHSFSKEYKQFGKQAKQDLAEQLTPVTKELEPEQGLSSPSKLGNQQNSADQPGSSEEGHGKESAHDRVPPSVLGQEDAEQSLAGSEVQQHVGTEQSTHTTKKVEGKLLPESTAQRDSEEKSPDSPPPSVHAMVEYYNAMSEGQRESCIGSGSCNGKNSNDHTSQMNPESLCISSDQESDLQNAIRGMSGVDLLSESDLNQGTQAINNLNRRNNENCICR